MSARLKESDRRSRESKGTRESLLDAAREVLAREGKEGLTVATVARLAGLNRGTAYEHFPSREHLIEATLAGVSDSLVHSVFTHPTDANHPVDSIDIAFVNERIANFAMENPALGRIWLFEVLSSSNPAKDRFWREFTTRFKRFAASEQAQPNIDVEVLSVVILSATFLWPVWASVHARSAAERRTMAQRFARELLRVSLHGSLRSEKYRELDERLRAKLDTDRT
jgi:AcrR family transcriptional regulator